MKKIRESIIMVLSFTICLLLMLPAKAFAYEITASKVQVYEKSDRFLNWTEQPMKEDVPINKVWSIVFTKSIDKSSLEDAPIYVKTNNDEFVDVDLQNGDDGKSVKVVPKSNYLPGHAYYLYITNRIKSSSGKPIPKPRCMTFTINANATKVDKTYSNKSIELKKGDVLELTLPENRDGGYFWTFKSALDSNMLKVIDETTINPSPLPNIDGGVGKKRWLIQAIGTGDTSINLEEYRPTVGDTLDHFNLIVSSK